MNVRRGTSVTRTIEFGRQGRRMMAYRCRCGHFDGIHEYVGTETVGRCLAFTEDKHCDCDGFARPSASSNASAGPTKEQIRASGDVYGIECPVCSFVNAPWGLANDGGKCARCARVVAVVPADDLGNAESATAMSAHQDTMSAQAAQLRAGHEAMVMQQQVGLRAWMPSASYDGTPYTQEQRGALDALCKKTEQEQRAVKLRPDWSTIALDPDYAVDIDRIKAEARAEVVANPKAYGLVEMGTKMVPLEDAIVPDHMELVNRANMSNLVACEAQYRREAMTLRDRCQLVSEENTALLAENARLRRALERKK